MSLSSQFDQTKTSSIRWSDLGCSFIESLIYNDIFGVELTLYEPQGRHLNALNDEQHQLIERQGIIS